MKKRNKLSQEERKQLGIFFLLAFAFSFLMGTGIFIGKRKGVDINSFANFHMMTPALGVALAMVMTRKDDKLLPKKAFIAYIVISLAMAILAWIPIFRPSFNAYMASAALISLGAIIFFIALYSESKEARLAYGLSLGPVKKILGVAGIFLILYFLRFAILTIIEDGLGGLGQNFSPLKLLLIPVLIINFFFSYLPFLGEEYGWRYFLQPILQEKLGMWKGLFALGIIWGLWHLPINIFYYSAPGTEVLSLVNQIGVCIAYSVFIAFAYGYTRSIWAPVLIHYVNNNFILFFVDLENLTNPDLLQNQAYTWHSLITMAIVNLIIFVPFILTKYNRDKNLAPKRPMERRKDVELALCRTEEEMV